MDIQDYGTKHRLKLSFGERDMNSNVLNLPKYYCFFERTNVRQGQGFFLLTGNGDSKAEALSDYASKISDREIEIGNIDKKVILKVPQLTALKLLVP